MTTTKYEFDAVRYCQENMHRMGVMPTGQAVGALIIAEIQRLRAENDTLRDESRVYREQCDMANEWRDKIEGELTALKEVVAWIYRKNYALSKREIIERVNALAALVGEEEG